MLKIARTTLCLISIVVGALGISVNNGGYEDINIVIENTVAENQTLLERIQEVFTKTSQLLFEATRQQVYFGQINIILPSTWSFSSRYTEIPAMAEPESYIIVGNDRKAKAPHTKRKKKKCGYPGWYIYLNTDFLSTEGKTKWGYPENVLVHEWGHFRWGLFEEYGTTARGRFYLDGGEWKPVRCSESVTGEVGKGNYCTRGKAKCNTTDTSQLLNETCRFCPNESQAESNMSSILAFNWVDGVSTFCDKDDDTVPINQRHNSEAPNKHNRKCGGRSAWEVMREHSDFETANLSPSTNTTPVFKILRETDGFRVFVLDVSGSMRGTRIATLYQACEYIIQTKIPEDSWLGIVWFSSSAETKMNMTRVTSQQVRDTLIAAIPQTAYGATCIGCGIDEAIRILTNKLGNPAGSEILVISDGANNQGDLDKSIQDATTANVTIHTISVSQAADDRMIYMATATGGNHISYLETGTISFASAFFEILSSGVTSSATESITLLSERLDSLTSNTVTFSFDIDSSVGINTTVSILQGSSSDISIEVLSPDGTVYSEQTNGDSIILDIPGTAVIGQFNVTVITQTSSSFEYYVTSLPTSSEAVRVVSWVTPVNLDFVTGELPVIEADVMKGRGAVLNATVTSVIETGETEPCEVTLLDNGAVPDDTVDDGVYAGVMPRSCFGLNGRVSAKVYVIGENGTASVQDVFSGAGSLDSDEDVNTEVLQDNFQRVTLPNEILVSNYSSTIASQDITAPGRITDVSITDISTENTQYGESRNFTITWTATGDDVNVGQAVEYVLRISEDQNGLINNFLAADLLDVANANFAPKVAGDAEYIRLEIDAEESYTSTTFFGVCAKDEAGNIGDVSNIVSILVANGYRIKVGGVVVYSQSNTDEENEEDIAEEERKKNLTVLAIGLSSAAAVIVIAIIAMTICMKKLKAKESVEDCEFGSKVSTTTVVSIDKPLKGIFTTMASRPTTAKKTFQSSQLKTIPEMEKNWTTAFSPRPLSPYPKKPFDIISQGSCNIEMQNCQNNEFAEQMEDYLNSDTRSISDELSSGCNSVTYDDGMTVENFPEAELDMLPASETGLDMLPEPETELDILSEPEKELDTLSEEAIPSRSEDKVAKRKFLAVFNDMPLGVSITKADDDFIEEANADGVVPGTVEIVEENHARKENQKGIKRKPRDVYFDERAVTCTSLSVEFPALASDEISQEISKLYEDVL